ncbi:cyclodeaminase/cyclohydrolase family protein [Clostridium sp. MSJ-8]|uniref:cyclodeaminase/cyclohydrolase family protein n=1 Tax=Clostridium sp. MSJ-8 TaxID=2841510 RepID=UPI001C0EA442|nr:cyclodeaminase/cyclohydrolase family protein [Clostridium sp. MSJ-8]MBU5487576.1 cyclodeaminase/cyclohydrolase family protein [Clostridium sp. MSJ-8]
MQFKEYKIQEFLSDLSSESPSPGGGSVAGLVAALAGSLNSMVYSLTVNKKAFEKIDIEDKKLVLDFKERSHKFINNSVQAMEKDREAFVKLMNCYKMPKDTEADIIMRKKALAENTIKAMMAPLELARNAYEFYDNIDIAMKYGNKMVLSDAVCAAILLNAAIEAAIENVKINLKSLEEGELKTKTEEEIAYLLIDSKKRKANILDSMNK